LFRTRRSVAGVAALGVVLAAGCGGGGGERLGRDEYAARADAVCREAVTERRGLPTPTAIADVPAYVERALPILDGARTQLRKLKPPKDLDVRVSDWFDALANERDALQDLGRAASDGDRKRVAELSAAAAENDRRARSLARAMGLVGCSNG
jgi:hypothetical protein